MGTTIAVYAGGLAVGYLVGFAATYFSGFTRQMLADLNTDPDPAAPASPTSEADKEPALA